MAGAFKGLNGRVTRVLPAKQRGQILSDMMGSSIAAELSLEMLLFRKRGAASLVLQESGASPGRGPRFQHLARPRKVSSMRRPEPQVSPSDGWVSARTGVASKS